MDSVTQWLGQLRDSRREQAAENLWNRYLRDLLGVARNKLGATPKAVADEHDVAVTAFMALLDGVQRDRFSRLNDRNDLWQVLVMLTERKAFSQRRAQRAQKRGGGRSPQQIPLDLASPEPTPELAVGLAEEYHRRLAELPDDLEREIAVKRLQGYSNRQIAESLDIPLRTVERKLNLIRRTWSEVEE